MMTGLEVFGAVGVSLSSLNVAIRSLNSALELWEEVKAFNPRMQSLGERMTSFRFSFRLTLELYSVEQEKQNEKPWENRRVFAILHESLPNAIEAAIKCDENARRLVRELPRTNTTSTTRRTIVMLRKRRRIQELERTFSEQMEVMNSWQTNLTTCLMMLVSDGVSSIGGFLMPDTSTIERNKDIKSVLALVISPEIQKSTTPTSRKSSTTLISRSSSPESPTLSPDNPETHTTEQQYTTTNTTHLDGLNNIFRNSDIFGISEGSTTISYKQDEELEHCIREENEIKVWKKIYHMDSVEVTSWAATGVILACKHGKLGSLSWCLQAISKSSDRLEALSLLGPDGLSALHHALKKQPQIFNIDIVLKLLESGANIQQRANTREGYYPMHYCIKWCKSVRAVEEMANRSPQAVNDIDSQGHTALFYAVAKTEIDLTRVLAEKLGATYGEVSPPVIPARFERERIYKRLQSLQKGLDGGESVDADGRRSSTSSSMTRRSSFFQTQSSIRMQTQSSIMEQS